MLWFRKIRLRKYVPHMLPPLKGNQSHRMMPPGRLTWALPRPKLFFHRPLQPSLACTLQGVATV